MITDSGDLSIKGFMENFEDCPNEPDEVLQAYLDCQFGKSNNKSEYFYNMISQNKDEALIVIENLINNL